MDRDAEPLKSSCSKRVEDANVKEGATYQHGDGSMLPIGEEILGKVYLCQFLSACAQTNCQRSETWLGLQSCQKAKLKHRVGCTVYRKNQLPP